MISVCSVKVTDPSIRQQICSLYRVTTFPDSYRLLQLQQQHQAVDSAVVNQGYSRCVQEVAHFLSKEEVKTQSQRRLLNHFNKLQSSSDKNLREADFSPLSSTVQTSITKDKSPVNSILWRPW
ncbi:transcription factor HES-5-like protein [Lates japonicus]|uniref:Transcription factor HES-5-like protein n=1 Tax=Lates japonicus TaxID=270547 RepID=A0AAD3N7P0_LATJO|nr:transcription factor HES-5-like protein [Lates japonicus]